MRFELLPRADADLLEQYSYLLRNANEAVADRFLLAAEQTFANLAAQPLLGTPCDLRHSAWQDLRSWPFEGFSSVRAYYVELPHALQVVRILHGKRDLETQLQDTEDDPQTPTPS